MPEYIPSPQPPYGLAEQTVQLANQRKSNWEAVANGVSSLIGSALDAHQKTASNINPQQAQFLGINPAPMPPGYQGPQQGFTQAFPKGAPMPLVEKLLQEKTQRELQLNKNEAAATRDHTLATDAMLANYPKLAKLGFKAGDQVPNRFIAEQVTPAPASLGLRDEQFWAKQWVDAAKDMDVTKASSRTPLGVATINNQKSARATQLLNSKKAFTPQDLNLITTDLAAMMKGGSPDEELLRQQQYGNYYTQGVSLLQRLTSKPQDANLPEVKEHLKDVINGIVQVDNQVIKDHVDNVESGRADVIAKRPKDWEKLKSNVLKNIVEDKNGKKDPAARFSELEKSGLSEAAIYKKLHEEGY